MNGYNFYTFYMIVFTSAFLIVLKCVNSSHTYSSPYVIKNNTNKNDTLSRQKKYSQKYLL